MAIAAEDQWLLENNNLITSDLLSIHSEMSAPSQSSQRLIVIVTQESCGSKHKLQPPHLEKYHERNLKEHRDFFENVDNIFHLFLEDAKDAESKIHYCMSYCIRLPHDAWIMYKGGQTINEFTFEEFKKCLMDSIVSPKIWVNQSLRNYSLTVQGPNESAQKFLL